MFWCVRHELTWTQAEMHRSGGFMWIDSHVTFSVLLWRGEKFVLRYLRAQEIKYFRPLDCCLGPRKGEKEELQRKAVLSQLFILLLPNFCIFIHPYCLSCPLFPEPEMSVPVLPVYSKGVDLTFSGRWLSLGHLLSFSLLEIKSLPLPLKTVLFSHLKSVTPYNLASLLRPLVSHPFFLFHSQHSSWVTYTSPAICGLIYCN